MRTTQPPPGRCLLFVLVAFLSTSTVITAQFLQYGSGQLPQCAQQCTTLQQAQTLCIPPDAPTVQKTCFCQSGLLTQLPSNPEAVCAQVCSSTESQQIQQWYTSYCQNPNAPVGGASSSASPPGPASTTAPAGSSQTSGGTTINGQSVDTVPGPDTRTWFVYSLPWLFRLLPSSSSKSCVQLLLTCLDELLTRPCNEYRWQKHSKWIAMVIVLVIAFAIIIAVGVVLKKRHDRRFNRATVTPLPTSWGPNSDPHAYGNSAANSGAALVGGRRSAAVADEEKNAQGTAAQSVGVSPNVGVAARQEKSGAGDAQGVVRALPGGKKLKKIVGR